MMIDFCRDGWEGEPKRTINAFTFQVNINTSLGTIFLIIEVITSFVSFVLSINMIFYSALTEFPFALPKALGNSSSLSGCINPAFNVLAILIALYGWCYFLIHSNMVISLGLCPRKI